jgi:hypothetical protein
LVGAGGRRSKLKKDINESCGKKGMGWIAIGYYTIFIYILGVIFSLFTWFHIPYVYESQFLRSTSGCQFFFDPVWHIIKTSFLGIQFLISDRIDLVNCTPVWLIFLGGEWEPVHCMQNHDQEGYWYDHCQEITDTRWYQ